MSGKQVNRKLSCILSTDVVGYSRLMEENEASTVRYLEENKKLISGLIEGHNGRVVDSPGDNLLAEFNSAVKAVDCAVKIQKELKIKNAELVENRRMQFRIGINLGEVIEEDGRIYGSGVNIAARLEGLAEPGGICISKKVYDEIKTKLDLGYDYLGVHEVKNIAEPVRVYRVQTGIVNAESINDKKSHTGLSGKIAFAAILIIIIGGLLVWQFYPSGHVKTETTSTEPQKTSLISDAKQEQKSIAVLPFEDISPDKDQEYFVDGLSEQIINDLTKISNLNVTSRTSSFTFKGSNKTAKEIAEILEREYILEGSVRKAGNALKITAQLIRAEDDSHIWSEVYDRELKDIFEIQEDIATNIADKLKLTLDAFQLVGGTENIKAYELYLNAKGMSQILLNPNKANEDMSRRIKMLDKAIKLDSEFALAWSSKCIAHSSLSLFLPADQSSKELEKALNAARTAIAIEPNLGQAYLALGAVYTRKSDFLKAGEAYRQGVKLTSESIDYFEYELPRHYAILGYLNKSTLMLEDLLRKDPLRTQLHQIYMINLALLGNIKQAGEEYKRYEKLFRDQPFFVDSSIMSYLQIISKDELPSINELSELPGNPGIYGLVKGNKESPQKALAALREIYENSENLVTFDFYGIALRAIILGDQELSWSALKKSISIQSGNFWLVWSPVMSEIRQTPRFKEFVRKIGFVDYWKRYGMPDLCQPVGDDDFVCE